MTRRIVTGHREGSAVVLSDGVPTSAGYPASMGFDNVEFWATEPVPGHPAPDVPPSTGGALPAPGATQLLVVTFPPDSAFADPGFDPAAAGAEQLRLMPGIARCFEPGAPGMHRTPTIDYVVILEGELILELDDGATVAVGAGDIVVQNGTRHAWRNPGTTAAKIAAVLIGGAAAPIAGGTDAY